MPPERPAVSRSRLPTWDEVCEQPIFAVVVTLVVALVIVSPALSSKPKDGYPLSTYPMFAWEMKRVASVEHAVYFREGSTEAVPVAPRFVGTDEVLQARATIARAIRRGAERQAEVCAEIAGRLAKDGSTGARIVELRTGTYDAVAYFTEDRHAPQKLVTHVRCPVSAR